MKKKIIIGSVFVAIIIIGLLLIFMGKTKYTIIVSLVDDQSPDRILTVYDENDKKIEVRRIEYLDGTLLCHGYNTTVHYGDIKNVKELKVILKDKTEVKAKIVEEEVKK